MSVKPTRLSALLRDLAAGLREQERSRGEVELGLPNGSLLSGQLMSDLGIDSSRPIVVAISGLNEAGQAILTETHALLQADKGKARELNRILRSHKGISSHLRVLVPSADPDGLFRSIELVLDSGRWRKYSPQQPELRGVFVKQERALILSVSDGYGVVDLYQTVGELGTTKAVSESAVSQFNHQQLDQDWQEPELNEHGAKAVLFPARLAQLGALETTVEAHESARKGRDEQRERAVGEALAQSNTELQLGENHGSAWINRAEITVDVDKGLPQVALRAELGQAALRSGQPQAQAAQSVDLGETLARFDIATTIVDPVV
jgi:hypothetical protein